MHCLEELKPKQITNACDVFWTQIKTQKCTDRVRRFRLTFLSILSETVFSHVAPVSNEDESERRTLCTDLSNHMTESGVTSCIFFYLGVLQSIVGLHSLRGWDLAAAVVVLVVEQVHNLHVVVDS
jgi:hypothetical protein